MATMTSPDWRGFSRPAPQPAHSPMRPAMPRLAPPAAFPSWWPDVPPPITFPPSSSRLEAGAASEGNRLEAGAPLPPPAFPQANWTSRLEGGAARGAPASQPPPQARPAAATSQPSQARPGQAAPPPPVPPRPAPAASPAPQPEPPRQPQPLSPRLRLMLEWVVAALPERQREAVFSDFVETLYFRAGLEDRCSLEGARPIGRERFGLAGEDLIPEGTVTVRVWLDDEVREILHTFERRLSRTRRNHYLAMHSARLGQLWRELETRFDIDVLEEVKRSLGRYWA